VFSLCYSPTLWVMLHHSYVVVVCTGNTCRSPMAAALLQRALQAEDEPVRSLRVISAGVGALSGEAASQNSVLALKKIDIDISSHRSQPLTNEMVSGALAVFCMTESHRAMIRRQLGAHSKNIYLFRQFLPRDKGSEISDPYGGSLPRYEQCRDEMIEAVPSVVAFLKRIVQ